MSDTRSTLPEEGQALRKLASIGKLAGGIAHEIKNPLSIIVAQAQMATELGRQGKLSAPQMLNVLERIEAVALRIAQIVRGMESLSHPGAEASRCPVSAGALVEDAKAYFSPRLREARIGLSLPDPPDVLIRCQPVQISQALVILVCNAIDAIADAGPTIAEGQREIELRVERGSECVRFKVSDTGPGVDPAVRARIFEPLYTTKAYGSGFGLSICRELVESHGGRVFLDELEPRTTFVIELPLAG